MDVKIEYKFEGDWTSLEHITESLYRRGVSVEMVQRYVKEILLYSEVRYLVKEVLKHENI